MEIDLEKVANLMQALLARLNEETPSSTELYGEYLLRWYGLYKEPNNGRNTNIYMLRYIARINTGLGNIPLNAITADKIQSMLNGIKENNTRIKIGMIIKSSLRKAVNLRLIKYNPFDAVEIRTYKKKHYRAISLPEQTRILDYLTSDLYIAIFRIMVCTGVRIGEFLAISETCIDFDNRLIKIDNSVDIRTGELQGRTKTYSSVRMIPFLPALNPYLKTVLTYVRKNGPITYNQVKQYYKRKFAKLEIIGLNLHSFRHTFGSMCYTVGISDKMIQRLMGHASLDVTMNVYVDLIGGGSSPLLKYFKMYEKDLKIRHADFWVLKT